MGDKLKNVLIIFGGNSCEHNISCKSVNFIINNIDKNLFTYKVVGIDFNNNWYEINDKNKIDENWKNNIINKVNNIIEYLSHFDIVFPVIHGNGGEDGKLQGLFELNNIKYVGCDSYSSLICYDKLLTKLILEKYSIPQVPYIIYNKNINLDNIQYPVIIKPCKCGSSIGINVAHTKKELKKYIKEAYKYDNSIIIEKFIQNKKELECAIIEDKNRIIVSNIGEILNDNKLYDFDLKYKTKANTKILNINLLNEDIQKYSKRIFEILGCKGLSRIDFLYDLDENKLYFNEINTMPGFTEISMYPMLINNLGYTFKDMISTMINS